MKELPAPGSEDARAQGCICNAEQSNQNWTVFKSGCPVHTFDYVMEQAMKPKARKGRHL